MTGWRKPQLQETGEVSFQKISNINYISLRVDFAHISSETSPSWLGIPRVFSCSKEALRDSSFKYSWLG